MQVRILPPQPIEPRRVVPGVDVTVELYTDASYWRGRSGVAWLAVFPDGTEIRGSHRGRCPGSGQAEAVAIAAGLAAVLRHAGPARTRGATIELWTDNRGAATMIGNYLGAGLTGGGPALPERRLLRRAACLAVGMGYTINVRRAKGSRRGTAGMPEPHGSRFASVDRMTRDKR